MALGQYGVQLVQRRVPAGIEPRVVGNNIDAQPDEPPVQPATDMAVADNSEPLAAEQPSQPLRVMAQHTEHVIDDGIGVGPGRPGKGYIPPRQGLAIDVVVAAGGGAYKPQRTGLRQQWLIDAGDRAHQQHIDPVQLRGLKRPAVKALHPPQASKQRIHACHIGIGQNSQTPAPQRSASRRSRPTTAPRSAMLSR